MTGRRLPGFALIFCLFFLPGFGVLHACDTCDKRVMQKVDKLIYTCMQKHTDTPENTVPDLKNAFKERGVICLMYTTDIYTSL